MAKAKEKDIFTAIKEDDLEAVRAMLAKDPSLVNSVAPKKPVDTKGMSPLQVSLTTNWHRDIADFLLDSGAAVNYMEPPELHIPQAHPVFYQCQCVPFNADNVNCLYTSAHFKRKAQYFINFILLCTPCLINLSTIFRNVMVSR